MVSPTSPMTTARGGTVEEIHTTIQHGIRYKADPETRDMGTMPAFGRDGLLDAKADRHVISHVRSLSGLSAIEGADLAAGAALFTEQCASCHGDKGQGDKSFGAPALADKIWLYGSDIDVMRQTLMNGRGGMMPTLPTVLTRSPSSRSPSTRTRSEAGSNVYHRRPV